MLRKDVKIGLAIGAVLLVVLVVYSMVPKSTDKVLARKDDDKLSVQAAPAGEDGAPPADTDAGVAPTDDGSPPPELTPEESDAGTDDRAPVTPAARPPAVAAGDADAPPAGQDRDTDRPRDEDVFADGPVGGRDEVAISGPSRDDKLASRDAARGTPAEADAAAAEDEESDTNWLQILHTGELPQADAGGPPTLMTTTPGLSPGDRPGGTGIATGVTVPPPGSGTPAGRPANETPAGIVVASGGRSPAGPDRPVGVAGQRDQATAVAPAGAPGAASPGVLSPGVPTHTVQPNETLSSIAQAVYGKAKYYRYIVDANPGVVATNLRPGMVLKMPEVPIEQSTRAQLAADTQGGSRATARAADRPAPIDPTREYRVQSGDSLYKISVRLYGRGDRIDELYELNRQTIGEDPARLKVGSVLRLPAPVAATR